MKELIESRQIRAFVAVARRGNFTQGAKDVFLTQSAVSHAIKSLEDDLGCALFQRVGRRAKLTHAGELLLQHCEGILHKMQDTRLDLSRLQDAARPGLRIGAPMTVCQHILPGVFRQVQEMHPGFALRLETGDNPELLTQLLSGRIDLAIVLESERRVDLVCETLFRDELEFVMLPSHAWAQAERIDEDEIRQTTLIVPNRATRTHQLITSHFGAARTALGHCIEIGSLEAMKELVKNGLGVGIIAPWTIRSEIARGELVTRPLGRRPLVRVWQAVYLRARGLGAVEESVVRFFRATAPTVEPAVGPITTAGCVPWVRRGLSASRPSLADAR